MVVGPVMVVTEAEYASCCFGRRGRARFRLPCLGPVEETECEHHPIPSQHVRVLVGIRGKLKEKFFKYGPDRFLLWEKLGR